MEKVSETNPCSPTTRLKGRQFKKYSWGLIWKKQNREDTGTDFRLNNIYLKGDSHTDQSVIVCHLCQKPYNSDLTYIRCETCQSWYHGDAVELEESKIIQLVGYKCCRCRRIKSPLCPYMDAVSKKPRTSASKPGNTETDFVNGTAISGQSMMEEAHRQDSDSFILPVPCVERITEQSSEVDIECYTSASRPGRQKLPVRRNVKRQRSADGGISENNHQLSYQHSLNPKENSSIC